LFLGANGNLCRRRTRRKREEREGKRGTKKETESLVILHRGMKGIYRISLPSETEENEGKKGR
jgi:hypothetical protein